MTPDLNVMAIKRDRPLRREYKPPDECNPDAERLLQNMMREQGEQWRELNQVQWQRAARELADVGDDVADFFADDMQGGEGDEGLAGDLRNRLERGAANA